MIIDVELTRRADGQYIARALQIPDVVVEATSRDGALQQMRSALMSRRAGTELVRIDIGDVGKAAAWPRHAGAFLDDEAYRRMLAEVERERLALDQAVAA